MKYLYLLVILFFINSYSISGDDERCNGDFIKHSKFGLAPCHDEISLINAQKNFKYKLSLNRNRITINKYKIDTDKTISILGTIHINPNDYSSSRNEKTKLPPCLEKGLKHYVNTNLRLGRYCSQLPLLKKYLASMDKSDLFYFADSNEDFGYTLLLSDNEFILNKYKKVSGDQSSIIVMNPSNYKKTKAPTKKMPEPFKTLEKNSLISQDKLPLIKKFILIAYKFLNKKPS